MQITGLSNLTAKFDKGYELIIEDFISFQTREKVFELPLITLKMSLKSPKDLNAVVNSDLVDFTLSNDKGVTSYSFRAKIVTVNSPDIGIQKTVTIHAQFYNSAFISDFKTKAYIGKTGSEVLSDLKALKIENHDFTVKDTFYRMNSSEWSFLKNQIAPNLVLKQGYPLLGVSISGVVRVLDISKGTTPKHKLAPDALGHIPYNTISVDNNFSKENFKKSRYRASVVSDFKSSEYLETKDPGALNEPDIVLSNGNATPERATAKSINSRKYSKSKRVIIYIKYSLDSIQLLDYVSLRTASSNLDGNYFVVGIENNLSTNFAKNIVLIKELKDA